MVKLTERHFTVWECGHLELNVCPDQLLKPIDMDCLVCDPPCKPPYIQFPIATARARLMSRKGAKGVSMINQAWGSGPKNRGSVEGVDPGTTALKGRLGPDPRDVMAIQEQDALSSIGWGGGKEQI